MYIFGNIKKKNEWLHTQQENQKEVRARKWHTSKTALINLKIIIFKIKICQKNGI